MINDYDLILSLTSAAFSASDQPRILNDFAYEFGWRPSDRLDAPALNEFSNAHLVVEHGLENTAVISFIKKPYRFSDLGLGEQRRLIEISYNNLVDWHIQVEAEKATFVFNRTYPFKPLEYEISHNRLNELRGEIFEQVVGKRPSPNLPALDSALINTISWWKRRLSAELSYSVSNASLSALFNSIIFLRAIEDHFRKMGYARRDKSLILPTLYDVWQSRTRDDLTLREIMRERLLQLTKETTPEYLFQEQHLEAFDTLSRRTIASLLLDFYRNKSTPYEYDFSLISQHALSRIYEHYVSVLWIEDSPQLTLFPRLPEEERDKAYGSIYTPQFIARFFARYLREQMPPSAFKRIVTCDPACGSGIFLRSLLELQCDLSHNEITTDAIDKAFGNVVGLDIDVNACQATRLSLALLHLVLADSLPQKLSITAGESIEYFENHPEDRDRYDAVIANPPFVAITAQEEKMRRRLADFMEEHAGGRIDSYLAFLRIGLEILKPGGFGLFVLPHSFLLSRNAAKMRKLLSETSWIRCLADLSAIRVFEQSGSYVILLIFQKRQQFEQQAPLATIIKCQDMVGRALQDALENQNVETKDYSIHEVGQDTFKRDEWLILPPAESTIERKLKTMPVLGDFFEIRLGFISGADDVFIVPSNRIPKGENSIFVPFLPDREMSLYSTPARVTQHFFYPYVDGQKVEEEELRRGYPKTWSYLSSHREKLQKRSQVVKGNLEWWRPERPRVPQHMMRPKIVTPHLVLLPRFSLDAQGKYAISRAPLLYPRLAEAEGDLLRFFVAVLNSSPCFWFISSHSHRYRGGYVMLEPKTLNRTPVPDIGQISPVEIRRVTNLVDSRLAVRADEALRIERDLDNVMIRFYGLSKQEMHSIGMD